MALDQWLVKGSWLGELVFVLWGVELELFSLECSTVSSSEFWGICGFGMALGSPSFNVQGSVLNLGVFFLTKEKGIDVLGMG